MIESPSAPSAALVAAGIVLFGADDEDSADDPVTPAGSSAPTESTEPLASAATSESATTIPTTTVARTTTVPRTTVPVAVPPTGDIDATTTSRPGRTTATTLPGDTTETSGTTEPELPEYDLDKTPDCEMQGSARLDDSGPDVACLEERLEEVTIGGVDFDVDEVFDEDTDTAVRQFQQAHDLIVDGIAGVETATLLRIWPGSND